MTSDPFILCYDHSMDKIADILIYLMNQVGYAVCHQMPGRTLVYQGRKLPVCARDAGLFLGIALCLVVLLIACRSTGKGYPSTLKTVTLACFILPMLFDALTSYAGLRTTTNDIRLATGLLAGTGIAALVFPIVSRALFKGGENGCIFQTWRSIALPLAISAGVFLALQPDWFGAYWVWAFLITVSIIFTFFILSCALINLVLEWRRGTDVRVNRAIMTVAFLVTVVELVLFNRMHWLVYRL